VPRQLKANKSRLAFANALFSAVPEFRPTRALYLDFEGSGAGDEGLLSLFWPWNAGPERFQWIWKPDLHEQMDPAQLKGVMSDLGCDARSLEWVVVFSGGKDVAEEQERFETTFGHRALPLARWVNLHRIVTMSTVTKRAIRDARNVWHTGEKRTRYSLEALEYEFNIRRPPELRSHSNSYADGRPGLMNVLTSVSAVMRETADQLEEENLHQYCVQDVRSMFDIARASQKLLRIR